MAYPAHHWEGIHPFQALQHNKSSSAAWRTENGLPTPSLVGILKHLGWVYPFSVIRWLSHSQCILQLAFVLTIVFFHLSNYWPLGIYTILNLVLILSLTMMKRHFEECSGRVKIIMLLHINWNNVYEIIQHWITKKLCKAPVVTNATKHNYGQVLLTFKSFQTLMTSHRTRFKLPCGLDKSAFQISKYAADFANFDQDNLCKTWNCEH